MLKLNELIKNTDLKLPTEWIQMFRILLSIYLAWLVLFSPRKPVFKNTFLIRLIFILALILFSQSDIISAILVIIIYFYSFQVVLPMENFESNPQPNPIEKPISEMIDENLKRGYETEEPTKQPIQFNVKNTYKAIFETKK
jgi:hypothetical protein